MDDCAPMEAEECFLCAAPGGERCDSCGLRYCGECEKMGKMEPCADDECAGQYCGYCRAQPDALAPRFEPMVAARERFLRERKVAHQSRHYDDVRFARPDTTCVPCFLRYRTCASCDTYTHPSKFGPAPCPTCGGAICTQCYTRTPYTHRAHCATPVANPCIYCPCPCASTPPKRTRTPPPSTHTHTPAKRRKCHEIPA